jgi:hypothetical protein
MMLSRWLSFSSVLACLLLSSALVQGQEPTKWTNPDGKEIVGEFVRMNDKSLTLRLANGKEATIALSSLSLESHLQALKMAKPDNFTKELVKAPEMVEPAKLPFKLTASSVITSPFDDDASIDSFMQTFTKEINRGNVFIVWHMMPPPMQTDMAALISKGLIAAGPTAPNQMRKVFTMLASITSKKRDWILDPAITSAPIPETELAKINEAWPAIVGFFTDMSDKSIWDPNNFRPEKVPSFLASLLVNFQYFEQLGTEKLSYNIVSQSADRAEVELSIGPQKSPVVQFQKVGKIWVAPELMNEVRKQLNSAAKVQMGPQVATGFSQAMFIVLPVLTKLDDAKTKDEFKKTVESITAMIPMPPGGLPGGFPGIPGFGGN